MMSYMDELRVILRSFFVAKCAFHYRGGLTKTKKKQKDRKPALLHTRAAS